MSLRSEPARGMVYGTLPLMPAALDGLRILDLTQYESGTACTQALAWLGADVVKIERPGTGDPGRSIAADFEFEDSEYFLYWNANKRSVTLALDQPEGRDLLLRMLPRFDVLVENFGPGVTEKLALGYEEVRGAHPEVIYASIRGFGADGPYSRYKCFDSVAQAAAGALSVTGLEDGPPMRPGPTTGDSGTGVQMALAITAAWAQRLRTGKGQHIEISMQEAMTYFMRTAIAMGSRFGTQAARRMGTGYGPLIDLYPTRPFGTNDYVYIMVVTERMWQDLCAAIGHPEWRDDPRFETARKRLENAEPLRAALTEFAAQHDKHSAMRILAEAGVPASAVFDSLDLFNDPHLEERGFITSFEHPELGTLRLLGSPFRMSESQVEIEAAPRLGEHTDAVLEAELELSSTEIAALRARGVVGDRT